MTISLNDTEAELSYAYLHAVASQAGFACSYTSRLVDNMGIDAIINVDDKLDSESILYNFSVDIQLKATMKQLKTQQDRIEYTFRGIPQYNKLRSKNNGNPRIVVLLMLPENKEDWLSISSEQLILKNAAYWVSLYGALESENTTSQTIYFPTSNLLTVTSLKELMIRISKGEKINYEQL